MGQAKNRGSRDERIAQAHATQQDQPPINIPCKTCGEKLNGFTLLQVGVAGAAWQKKCECGAITTALVQPYHSSLARTFASTLGMAKEIADGKKVSVSFLQKTVETVETGLVLF